MARAATTLLILASCAALATAVFADDCSCTKTRKFQFFEHSTTDTLVFSPSQQIGKHGFTASYSKGDGYVYDNLVTKTYDSSSEHYGYVGGMYFFVSKTVLHEVSTIFFHDINEKGGTFAEAEAHLRGIWRLNEDGTDQDHQEFAIVGGTKGLSGAYGTVVYNKVAPTTWLVQGVIFLDSATCDSLQNAHIRQAIRA